MSKLSVLIIETEENICNFIRASLKPQGYKVITASTAAEGLTSVNSGSCDLILLDLGLPNTDGIEVIRQVRVCSSLPVLVISARTQEQEKSRLWMPALTITSQRLSERPGFLHISAPLFVTLIVWKQLRSFANVLFPAAN